MVLLGAIWGASFLFVRIVAPVLGPVLTADLRMLVAGAALAAWFFFSGFRAQWRRFARQYFLAALLTSALPFLFYAYAALSMTAGQMAVLNATSPMWGALLSSLFLNEKLTFRTSTGLLLGVAGVALVARPETGALSLSALAACLGGALLLPFVALSPPLAAPTALVAASVLALGLVSGAIAYVLYFRLIADIGATGALTVTYLTPVFGMLWGSLFLGEALTATMLLGAALVVLGTAVVLRR